MTKKKGGLIIAGIFAMCVCLVFGVFVMLPPRRGVTKSNFDRIPDGATLAEVREIFGRAPDQESLGFMNGKAFFWRMKDDGRDDGGAVITFKDEVISRKSWDGSTETIAVKIRRWLHLK